VDLRGLAMRPNFTTITGHIHTVCQVGLISLESSGIVASDEFEKEE
jgi:hypothetical protein